MEYNWNLTELYKKKDDFYFDMTVVRDKIKKLLEHREIKIDGTNLYNLMSECFDIRRINSKTLLYASLNYYSDINNESFITMKNQAEELDGYVLEETSFIDELITIIDDDKLEEFYKECTSLLDYKYYIDNVKRTVNHLGFDNIDKINSNILDINKNIVKYNTLFKDMNFGVLDGVLLNNTNVNEYLISNKRDIRKKTFLNINNSYLEKGDLFYSIYSSIIGFRKDNALLKNYNSVLENELDKDNINCSYINNLINIVNENIHIMNRYLSLKCNYLDILNPSLYDINLSMSNNTNTYSIDRAFEILDNVFIKFGKDYFNEYELIKNKNYLDLSCNDRKHPSIVFSWNNYVFMNYKERYIDLKNLSHEIGHVINYSLSLKKQSFIYSDSNVFVGEVASLVNEILLNDYLWKCSSDKEEKIFYLSKIIENFISQVYRQTMYTEFENLVYNSNQLDLDLLNDGYLSLIKKYYGNVLSIDDSIRCEWMRVGHLFRWNYYMYKYASGYLLAFNIVNNLSKDGYLDKYIDFLSSGSSMDAASLLKKIDIDIYDKDIFVNSFTLLEEYINELEELLCEEK